MNESQALRKLQVQQRIAMERSELRYHAKALRQPKPIKRLWRLAPATLTPRTSPSSVVTTLAVGMLTKRLGLFGKLVRIGVTLYPFIRSKRL